MNLGRRRSETAIEPSEGSGRHGPSQPQDRTGDHRRGVPDPHDVRPRVLPCGASLPDLRAHVPGLRPMVADRRPVGAGRGRARRTGRGVRRGRVADRQQGRAVGNRRQGTHPRGRVRACHGPWRGRGEGDAPARRGHGVKAHRSGPLPQGHVAGISAGAQHRGQHVDVHQLGGHGYRSGGPTFRQVPVLRDPGRALGTGPVPGDLEQGRYPRRDRPDPQARPSERRNMDVRPRTHRGPEPEERAVGVGPDRLGAVPPTRNASPTAGVTPRASRRPAATTSSPAPPPSSSPTTCSPRIWEAVPCPTCSGGAPTSATRRRPTS